MNHERPVRNVCLSCIDNLTVQTKLEPKCRQLQCTYCGETASAVPIDVLASEIDAALRMNLVRSETEVARFGLAGDSLEYQLQDLLRIDAEVATDLQEALIRQDPGSPDDGDFPFYSDEHFYQYRGADDWLFFHTWKQFAEQLKHNERFFSAKTAQNLRQILGAPGSMDALQLPVLELSHTSATPARIYRARRTDSAKQARKILAEPTTELSAPPLKKAIAGRMNPAGIPVFYGATERAVAIAEARPPVGSLVVVGAFEPTRTLRLLDLTRIGALTSTRDFFDADFSDNLARVIFLRSFHRLVTEPVQAHEEDIEYLPTQAVSEYIRNVLNFDGIFFASAQSGKLDPDHWDGFPKTLPDTPVTDCNVIVFGSPLSDNDAFDFESAPLPDRLQFPVRYLSDSAVAVQVRQVSVQVEEVSLHDHRSSPHGVASDF